jgi:MFS family permease
MRSLDKLVNYVKIYGFKHRHIYAAAFMLFFFAIFDGIFSFITPIYIVQKGISEGMMGIIIGTSSIAGLIFDVLLCRVLRDVRYRTIYVLLFIICLIYPLILWASSTAFLFIIAMVLWGVYYDLLGIGNLDFVSHTSSKKEYSDNFGVLNVFFTLGYLVAPLITGFLIIEFVDYKPFLAAFVFLILALASFIVLMIIYRNGKHYHEKVKQINTGGIIKELTLWRKIGNFILPVLIVSFMLNIIDAIYWTIGPLLSESMTFLGDLGGLFMMVYIFPPLIVGWFVGRVTARLGKKRTAFISMFIGSVFLVLFFIFDTPVLLVLLSFLSSFCTSFTSPAIAGAYADYINENPQLEKEISAMHDSFVNIGYIIGPVIAGFSGQYLGYINTFALLGVLGVIMTLILIKVTPKQINIHINTRKI